MGFWLTRVLLACAGMAAGALTLQGLTGLKYAAWMGSLGGWALASTCWLILDGRRTERLLRWMSGGGHATAPRVAGLHGELGFRIERALNLRDERTQMERNRLQQFLSAIEVSPNGVLLIDEDDQIQWFNRTAADHFGLDAQRDLRQRVTNLVRSPAFVAHLQGGDFGNGVSFTSPRSSAMLLVLVRPYADGMKLVLSQDVTERERHDTMRRDFVANVSHEIRSPLTVLAGFVETMSNLPLTEVERERVLVLMRQQTTRMEHLVTDLLTLAQIEGSRRPENNAWVGVAGLMNHVHGDAMASDCGRHRIEVDAGAAAEISGIESELFSAVWNLVSNALRYTPPGGRVTLRWTLRADGCGEFCVSDDGPGIAREHIPRLTERFYRVDGSRSRETGGTGLGLAIVKHVVQRHGGEMEIRSVVGQGSEFRLVFPPHRVRRLHEPVGAELAG